MHRFFARFNIVCTDVRSGGGPEPARTMQMLKPVRLHIAGYRPSLLVEVFLWNIIFRHLARVYFFLVGAIRLFNPSHGTGFEHISFSGQLIYAFRVRLLCPR